MNHSVSLGGDSAFLEGEELQAVQDAMAAVAKDAAEWAARARARTQVLHQRVTSLAFRLVSRL
jgi:phytoene/squalene synthetase